MPTSRLYSWYVRGVVAPNVIAGACGVDKGVPLAETYGMIGESDAAYRTNTIYRRYAASIVDSLAIADARAGTLELVPH